MVNAVLYGAATVTWYSFLSVTFSTIDVSHPES
jgi:hypothetical protein